METQVEQLLQYVRSHFFGKYRGKVIDNQDKTRRGKLLVSVPAVLHELQVWAMPCLPYAGNNVGVYAIPEPGAGVWVEFEGGDPSNAIWTGGFWADDELPKDEKSSEANPSLRIIKSEKGLLISFNDDSETLTVSDSDGSNIMTIEVQDGKIRLQASRKVVVEGPQIELVEDSVHPVVLGDSLMAYLNYMVGLFNTHLHPGDLALGVLPVLPSPPLAHQIIPPTPALLSTIVKTG